MTRGTFVPDPSYRTRVYDHQNPEKCKVPIFFCAIRRARSVFQAEIGLFQVLDVPRDLRPNVENIE